MDDVQMTINHHHAEMSEIRIKLLQEQHKTERLEKTVEQLQEELRDSARDLKV